MSALDLATGLAGTALFNRTFLLETNTPSGIPRLLIVIDSMQEEEPQYEADVTEHPVEQGTEITDHIQLKNPTLRLRGTISATPIDLATQIGNLTAGGLGLITDSQFRANFINAGLQQVAGALGASLLKGSTLNVGSAIAGTTDAISRSILISTYQRKARFSVITQRQRFTDMVIESMTFPRNADTGFALIFELNMKQIRVVSPQVVSLGTTSNDTANSAPDVTGQGSQAAGQIDAQTQASALQAQSDTGFNETLSQFKGVA